MRIRSIKPEFWTSEDVAALDIPTRLLFIGLWSYVDDNGVGRDVEKLIAASLFPLEEDPRESVARVSRGLATLAEAGLIARYAVDDYPYLHVTAWDRHQRIDKPAKPRYPLPTCEDAHPRETVARPSRGSRSWSSGAVEQGNRGTGSSGEDSSSPAPPSRASEPPGFADFYAAYPRKVGRDKAAVAYRRALTKTTGDVIVAGARRVAADPNLPAKQFVPHPATWLSRGGWDDEPFPDAAGSPHSPQQRDAETKDLLTWASEETRRQEQAATSLEGAA